MQPVLERLVPFLRELGHDPVAVIGARRPADAPPRSDDVPELADSTVPAEVDLLLAGTKHAIEPLLRAYEPDVALCFGFPWKIPLAALEVPRYGSVNHHPALLPRLRGPVPFAWALRRGDSHFGVTWHRMDAELDTGNLLAQDRVPIEDTDTTIMDFGPRVLQKSFELLPGVLDKLVAGDPGVPQDDSQATWAGHFEDDDYARVDWSQPARAIHNQVRAWLLTFNLSGVVAPRAELDGERLRLIRTSLTDPGDGSRRVECGDGPLWILESEPLKDP